MNRCGITYPERNMVRIEDQQTPDIHQLVTLQVDGVSPESGIASAVCRVVHFDDDVPT